LMFGGRDARKKTNLSEERAGREGGSKVSSSLGPGKREGGGGKAEEEI